MSEWSLLAKQLEDVLEWPIVLIPIVTDYVRVQMYEWNHLGLKECEGNKSRANFRRNFDYMGSTVLSKYCLDEGPSHWGFDIEFSPFSHDVEHGLRFGLWDVRSESWKRVISMDIIQTLLGGTMVVNNIPHNFPHMTIPLRDKYRILVTAHKAAKRVTFEYVESPNLVRYLGHSEWIESDDFLHAVPFVCCTTSILDDCSITFVE